MIIDRDRVLALAERIAEAWDIADGRRDHDKVVYWPSALCCVSVHLAPSICLVLWPGGRPEPLLSWPIGGAITVVGDVTWATDIARARLRLADAATDGLIADRLRRTGQTDWLDWLYPREDGDETITR